MKMSVAEAIGKTMKENGVEYFFYVMGGGSAGMRDWEDNAGIKTVMCRNEKSATNMADGYARVTKKPTVCYGQHGAAAMILASMLYEPMASHSPVIALTGATPTITRNQWTYQECYEMPSFQSTCKFNVEVTDANRVAEYIRTAIQIALSGCPGPCHVQIPQDMWNIVSEMPEIFGDKNFLTFPPLKTRPEQGKVVEAANILANAERPVMVCGSGVHWSGAYDEVKELAELLSIPVATVYGGKGCFPEDHPLYIGTPGSYGRPVTGDIIREADVVFFVATRAGRHHTQNLTAPIPATSKIIHLDIDPIAIGRNYKVEVPLVGDAKVTLQDLLATLKTLIAKPRAMGQRIEEIAKKIRAYESSVTGHGTDKVNSDAVPIWPSRVINEVSKFIGPRDIVVSDTGNMMSFTVLFLKLKGVGRTYIPVSGTLGSSFGLAIGASFGAAKDQRIIHMSGDGGMGYNLADIETSVRYKDQHVPMVTIINHNSIVGNWTREHFAPTSFTKIWEGFGGYGILVERPGEIRDALKEAFDSGKPAVLDIITEPTAMSRMGGL